MAGDECDYCDEETAVAEDKRGKKVTRWRGLMAPYRKPTGDKRRFAIDSLTARELPMPLKWQRTDASGHTTSVVVGDLDGLEYSDEGVFGTGTLFDPDPAKLPRLAEDVAEARLLLERKVIGPSVDLDDMEFHTLGTPEEVEALAAEGQRPEIEVTRGRISAATLVPIPAFAEARPFELSLVDPPEPDGDEPAAPEDDEEFTVRSDWDDVPVAPLDTAWEPDAEDKALTAGALIRERGTEGLALFPLCAEVEGKFSLIPRAVFTAASLLAGERYQMAIPANTQARMRGVVSGLMRRMGMTAPWDTEESTLLAGAGPLAPPRAWFEVPEPDRKTPFTITDDGQVYGHIAAADVPHIGFQGSNVYAPRSATGYAYFHVGAAKTAEGDELPVGKITMGAGHADLRYGYRAAAEHYDNSARAVAIVQAKDGRHGIWSCGALLPGLSDEQVAELRRSPISGDWREIGGSRELVAALAVNTPGFPIPRTAARVSGGRELALVAAGVLAPEGYVAPAEPEDDDARTARIVRATLDEEAVRQRKAAALVASLTDSAEADRRDRAARAALLLQGV